MTGIETVAWILNLRGGDIPYSPLFQSYIFIGLDSAILFVDSVKLSEDVLSYLTALGVTTKDYSDVWSFLRRAPWGQGRILLAAECSYAVTLMLTSYRFTITPSYIAESKAVKNETEIEGIRQSHLKDGAAYVCWLAWLEQKLSEGYDITEWEAMFRLMEYKRKDASYRGLADKFISASGPNSSIPYYSPTKTDATFINRKAPYLMFVPENNPGDIESDDTISEVQTVII